MPKQLLKPRRIWRWVVLGLVVVSSGAWLFSSQRVEPKLAPSRVESSAARESTRRSEPPRAVAAPKALRERRQGVWIERIDVDKSEVCYGEENFATVRAFDASGTSDRLIVRMSGSREMGFRLPFRIEKSDPRPRRVIVTGPGGPQVIERIPDVTVRDCEVVERATIDVSLSERSPHVLDLTAQLSSSAAGAPRFEPIAYEWDFGDGSTLTTKTATVQKSYEGKPEKTRFSYYLLRVKAKDGRGREVTGSRAYGFPNFGFGAFVDDRRILVHSAGGSMPGKRADDERMRLYHGFEGVVRLERVRSTELVRSENRELASTEDSAESLLGVGELLPGKSTTTLDLSSLRPTEPDRVRKLELIGRAGAYEARGTIVLTSTAPITNDASDAADGG